MFAQILLLIRMTLNRHIVIQLTINNNVPFQISDFLDRGLIYRVLAIYLNVLYVSIFADMHLCRKLKCD